MSDFLSAYSVQRWLESAPQAYLMNTEYGHEPGEHEPELMFDDEARHVTVLEEFKLRLGRIGIDYPTRMRR